MDGGAGAPAELGVPFEGVDVHEHGAAGVGHVRHMHVLLGATWVSGVGRNQCGKRAAISCQRMLVKNGGLTREIVDEPRVDGAKHAPACD
jgi:hypothetical protein